MKRRVFGFLALLLGIFLVACSDDSSDSSSSTTEKYTVTFSMDGGSAVEAQKVERGKTATMPTTPTKEGYTFVGWYTDSALTNAFSFDTEITANITLYAKWTLARSSSNSTWTKVTYNRVTFEANGGSAVATQNVLSGRRVTEPTEPTKAGFTFGGWYTNSALTSAFSFNTAITSNITLYAKWISATVPTYTATFESNGGSAVTARTVESGSTATEPADPTKDGFAFGGWYTDTGLTSQFSFSTAITTDITLYAKWITAYTVTFESNGGSAVDFQNIVSGGTATMPDEPTKANTTFGGWYSDSALTSAFSFSTPITTNTTLYAKWICAVTFVSNGGTAVDEQIVAEGGTATEPTAPTKTGATFGGWYANSTLTTAFNFSTAITTDTTLYAKWTYPVTVTFNSNGGSAVTAQTITEGENATEPTAPTKTGAAFGGWYSDSGLTTAFNFSTAITTNTTLYAKWITAYTVTFESNGGSAVTAQTITEGGTVTTPTTPTKTGATFGGWYSDSGLTTAFSFLTAITTNTTLYAKWNCTVTFESNGGSSVTAQTIAEGGNATEPTAPTKTGRTFQGWFSDTTLSAAPFDFTTAITADTTLYARWWTSEVFISGRNITIGNIIAEDHEVTQGEYETYCKYGSTAPSATYGVGANYPAYNVSWYDALVYCNKRSMAEGKTPCYKINGKTNPSEWPGIVANGAWKLCGPSSTNAAWNAATCDFTANGYRLPTEAEWEWLARGGDQTDAAWEYTYSGSDTLGNVAWYTTNSDSTHEVKGKTANSKGLYDMSGNVHEWCWDWYGTITAATTAVGAASGSNRVNRGGNWWGGEFSCAVSFRNCDDPYDRSFMYGFRVVRTAQ